MKLHLGCGARYFGKDWIHIDASNYDYIESHNVVKLPYNDNSVDVIYNCGLIQYFDDYEIDSVLKEWCRVLKKDGILRISNPDMKTICSLYSNDKFPLSNFIGPLFGRWNIGNNEYVYCKNAFDEPKLRTILERCGFYNIKKYNWRDTEHSHIDDYSQAYLPHMDKENGTLIMLNIECKKI
tara:strand:- start:6959 stop:7501 length:543 start_codon:yes stop_codon:yes gene_type:complete